MIWFEKVTSGDVRTVARLIRDVDDGMPEVREALKALYPYTGKAYVIGITGAPGVGEKHSGGPDGSPPEKTG